MSNAEFYGEKKVGNDVYGVKLVCSSTPNAATNSSEVTIAIYLIHVAISISKRKYPTHDCTYGIDGVTYTYETPEIKGASKDTDAPIVTKTVTIQHDSDGTKSIDVFANFPYNLKRTSDGVRVNTVTASGTFVLDKLGRASTIAEEAKEVIADGEHEWFVKMNRASDQFWHKGEIVFRGEGETGGVPIVLTPFETEARAVIPVSWLGRIPNSTSGIATVEIQTYADESCTEEIGDEIETTFVVKAPDSAGPVLGNGYATVVWYTSGGIQAAIQGHTQLEFVCDATKVTTVEGAEIKTWRVEFDGQTYSKDVEYKNGIPQKTSIMTRAITSSGYLGYRVEAVDSRGNTAKSGAEIYVYPYGTPVLTDILAIRVGINDSGEYVESENGQYLGVYANVAYSDIDGTNDVTIKVLVEQMKDGKTETIIEDTIPINYYWVVGNDDGLLELGERSSYTVTFYAEDTVGGEAQRTTRVNTTDMSFHIKKGGKGAAFGKYAEEDGWLDVAWKLKVEGDPVVGAKVVASGGYTESISVPTASGTSQTQRVYDNSSAEFKPGLHLVTAHAIWSPGSGSTRIFSVLKDGSHISLTTTPPISEAFTVQNVFAIVQVEEGETVSLSMMQDSGSDLNVTLNYTVARIGG